jgi:hypothetical protein
MRPIPDVADLPHVVYRQNNAPTKWHAVLLWLPNGYGLSILYIEPESRTVVAAVRKDNSAQGWRIDYGNPAMYEVTGALDHNNTINVPNGEPMGPVAGVLRALSELPTAQR